MRNTIKKLMAATIIAGAVAAGPAAGAHSVDSVDKTLERHCLHKLCLATVTVPPVANDVF